MNNNQGVQVAKEKIENSKALLFDFDGTVCNLDKHHVEFLSNIFSEKFNLKFTNSDFMKYISGRGSEDGIREFLSSHGITEFDLHSLNMQFADEKRKMLLTDDIDKYVYLMPGIREFLKYIQTKGKTCIIVTSSRKEYVETILKHFDIYKSFLVVFDRTDTPRGKPFPDPFLNAMECLELSRDECIAFEDSLFGLQSAKNANLFTVGILNPGWNDEFVHEISDIVIEDYKALI